METTISLANLGELRRLLEQQVSQLQQAITARSERVKELMQEQTLSETSPLSVFSRLTEAKRTLENEMTRANSVREETMKGSVELYWLHRLSIEEIRQGVRTIEKKEAEYRNQLFSEVANRFSTLIPPSATKALPMGEQSGGKLAVTLNETQGRNSELGYKLLGLESEETELDRQRERTEIACANAFAAGELVEFEARVLNYCTSTGQLPRTHGRGEGFGLSFLEQQKNKMTKLSSEIEDSEKDLSALRDMLVKAIDASEHPKAFGVAQELFASCEKIIRKHRDDATRGAVSFSF